MCSMDSRVAVFISTPLILLILLVTGCSPDQNKKANKIFVEATQAISNINTDNYTSAYKDYKKIQEHINVIFSKYPSSNVAVDLLSGQTKISHFTLAEFQSLESSLSNLSTSEHDPFFYANMVKNKYNIPKVNIELSAIIATVSNKQSSLDNFLKIIDESTTDNIYKVKVLNEVAIKLALNRRNDEAKIVQKKALIILQTFKHVYDQVILLVNFASKFAENGFHDMATPLLDQAFTYTKTITALSNKCYALAVISRCYAKIGESSKADEVDELTVEIVNSSPSINKILYRVINQADITSHSLSKPIDLNNLLLGDRWIEIATKYDKQGQPLNSRELKVLQGYVLTVYPINSILQQ